MPVVPPRSRAIIPSRYGGYPAIAKKKLCYICEATAGGVRKQLRLLCEQFSQREKGFEVHALFGDRGEPGFKEELEGLRRSGVRVTPVPSFCRAIRPGSDRETYRFLKAELRKRAPDIVHTHSAKAGFLGRLAAHACRTPRIVHTPHVFPFQWATGLSGALYLSLERYAARRCHFIVCVGKSQREEALLRRVAPSDKLVLVRNGVAVPEAVSTAARTSLRMSLNLPTDALIVGMVARLEPQKGTGIFVEAAARVVRQMPQTVFVLIGGGTLEGQMRNRAEALGLGPARLRILGHVEGAERYYPAFDVVALSSLYEGLPYALLEAMACGVPVVATNVLGSGEVVIDGSTGLLARTSDPADLAEKIRTLLESPSVRASLAATALHRVSKVFTLEAFYEGHRQVYLGSGPRG